MPLGDRAIKARLQLPADNPARLLIEPFVDTSPPGVISYGLTSAGYDLRLGRKFLVCTHMESGVLDPKKQDASNYQSLEADSVLVPPNSFVLGYSLEKLRIPRDCIGVCIGKSTYARCGIIVNVTPLEPEWEGHVTIEISNSAPRPARVYANEGILQVLFELVNGGCDLSYADKKGRYQGQKAEVTLPFVADKSPRPADAEQQMIADMYNSIYQSHKITDRWTSELCVLQRVQGLPLNATELLEAFTGWNELAANVQKVHTQRLYAAKYTYHRRLVFDPGLIDSFVKRAREVMQGYPIPDQPSRYPDYVIALLCRRGAPAYAAELTFCELVEAVSKNG